jgi:hypothetical protein
VRTIIAGSRALTDPTLVEAAVKASGFTVTTVISGTAKGIDKLGEQWAEAQGLPVERHPANWDLHGKVAGRIRNREMIDVAEALIAIWDSVSRGTEDCISEARRRGLKVYVHRISDAH